MIFFPYLIIRWSGPMVPNIAIYPMNYIFAPIMTYNTYIFMTYSIYNIFMFKQLLCLTCKFKTETNAGKSRVSLFWPTRSAALEPGKWKTWNLKYAKILKQRSEKVRSKSLFWKKCSLQENLSFSQEKKVLNLCLSPERGHLLACQFLALVRPIWKVHQMSNDQINIFHHHPLLWITLSNFSKERPDLTMKD